MSRLPPILSSTPPPLDEEDDDDDEINSSHHYAPNTENSVSNFEKFELDFEKKTSSVDHNFVHSNNIITKNVQETDISTHSSFENSNGQNSESNANIIQSISSEQNENSTNISKAITSNSAKSVEFLNDQETDIISCSTDDPVQRNKFSINEQTSFQTFLNNDEQEEINIAKNEFDENIKNHDNTKQSDIIESNRHDENCAQSLHFELSQFKDDSIKIKNKFSNMASTTNTHCDINIEFLNSDYDNFNDEDFDDFVTSSEVNYESHSKECSISNDNDAKLDVTSEDLHVSHKVNDDKSANECQDENTKNDKKVEENEDDWAFFDECVIKEKSQITTIGTEVPNNNDNFLEDDDFQGFESSEQQSLKTYRTLSDLEVELPLIFNYCIPPSTDAPLSALTQILEGNHIWSSVKTIENTPALKMTWTHCIFRKTLISGLGIDLNYESPRTLLPVFAKQLGMLQPTKLQPDEDYPVESATPDACNTSTTEQQQHSFPSVQFDWSNSVLNDPFQGGLISYLDLDFFANSFSKNLDNAKTSASIQEEKFLASLEKPIKNEKITKASNDIFINNNLNKNISTFTGFNEAGFDGDEDEKEVMKNLLEMIPDLSFMRAKALMFPMKA